MNICWLLSQERLKGPYPKLECGFPTWSWTPLKIWCHLDQTWQVHENRDFCCCCLYTHSVWTRPIVLGRIMHYLVSILVPLVYVVFRDLIGQVVLYVPNNIHASANFIHLAICEHQSKLCCSCFLKQDS